MIGDRLALTWAAAAAIALAAPVAHADELTDVYAQILQDPADTELNLQYAMIAEGRGEYRKALAAYERVLANDPDNETARRALRRVQRILQPPSLRLFAETGAAWETNPEHVATGADDDFLFYARLSLANEQPIMGTRWRTVANAYGKLYVDNDQFNYARFNAETGPLIDLPGTDITFRPAVGGGVAFLGGSYYYWDAHANAYFETFREGETQWLRVRGGYRSYAEDVTSEGGFYADIHGRVSMAEIFHEDDRLAAMPWVHWSGIAGTADDGVQEFGPGQYIDGGAEFAYSKALSDAVTAVAELKAGTRYYFVDTASPGGPHRHDYYLWPGATLLFANALGPQNDIKLNYHFEWNDSNDPDHDYTNHVVTVSLVARR